MVTSPIQLYDYSAMVIAPLPQRHGYNAMIKAPLLHGQGDSAIAITPWREGRVWDGYLRLSIGRERGCMLGGRFRIRDPPLNKNHNNEKRIGHQKEFSV